MKVIIDCGKEVIENVNNIRVLDDTKVIISYTTKYGSVQYTTEISKIELVSSVCAIENGSPTCEKCKLKEESDG